MKEEEVIDGDMQRWNDIRKTESTALVKMTVLEYKAGERRDEVSSTDTVNNSEINGL